MIIKLIGSGMILVCSIFFTISHRRFEEKKLRTLDGLIALITYIKGQVDCYALPIGEIFERADAELLFACGWRREEAPQALDELFSCCFVSDKEAKSVISEFCSDFGRNYREEQLKRCDACITALERCRERLEGEAPDKKKLNLTLLLCASAALVILLI